MGGQPYPAWICAPCGERWGRRPVGLATWHQGRCGVCGDYALVTEPRDYGHLRDGWQAPAGYDGLCPECGSVDTRGHTDDGENWLHRCEDCRHRWTRREGDTPTPSALLRSGKEDHPAGGAR